MGVKIIENTPEAMDEYGHYWGSDVVELTKDQINQLMDGKCLAFNDGEYSTFLVLSKED